MLNVRYEKQIGKYPCNCLYVYTFATVKFYFTFVYLYAHLLRSHFMCISICTFILYVHAFAYVSEQSIGLHLFVYL